MLYPVQCMELKQGQDTSRDTYILLTQRIIFFPILNVRRKNVATSSLIGLAGIFHDIMSIHLNDRD